VGELNPRKQVFKKKRGERVPSRKEVLDRSEDQKNFLTRYQEKENLGWSKAMVLEKGKRVNSGRRPKATLLIWKKDPFLGEGWYGGQRTRKKEKDARYDREKDRKKKAFRSISE